MDHSATIGGGQSSAFRAPAERARVLLEINNAVVSHLDLAQVLKSVSACLRREIHHDFAGLALYNAERHELRLHALDFPQDQAFLQQGQLIPLVGTPASLAFATRKPVLRHRPDFEEFSADIMKQAYARGIRSGCAVPLLCHDKIVGSMVLASLRESAFTEDDADLLTQIGTQVAIAVDNALNYERLRSAECEVVRERDRTKLLLEINNAVVSHLDLRELVKSISTSLRQIIPHDGAFFTLLDPEEAQLRVQALDLQMSDQTPFEEGIAISPAGTPEGEAIASGRAVLVVPRIDRDRFYSPWVLKAAENGINSGCAVPLTAHGRILGALSVVSQQEAAFHQDHATLLEQCSSQIAIAVENSLNFESARSAEREAKHERDRSRLLLEVNNAVVSHLDLSELLKSISTRLGEAMSNDSAFIALCHPDDTIQSLALDLGRLENVVFKEGFRIPMEGTPEGLAIKTGEAVVVKTVADFLQFSSPWVRYAVDHGLKSGCFNPLIAHGSTLGALGVVSLREGAFTPEAAKLLEQISSQIAIAVENALNFAKSRQAEDAAKKERDRSRLLLDINNALVSNLDLSDLVRAISSSLRSVLRQDFVGLGICDSENGKILAHAMDSVTGLPFDGVQFDPEGTIAGLALRQGTPVYLPRPDLDRFPSSDTKGFFDIGLKTVYSVPLTVHGRAVGVITYASSREDAWSKDEQDLLQEITKQVAIAMDNSINFERARQAKREAATERDRSRLLLDINNALVSHLDLSALVTAVSTSLQNILQHDCVGLAIYDAESGKLFSQAVTSELEPMHEGIYYSPEGSVSGLAFKKGEPVYVPRPDSARFPSTATKGFFDRGLKSIFAVPITVHGRVLGVISVSSVREDAFTQTDQELFKQVAKQVAIAAANAVAVRELGALKDKLAQEKLYLEDEIRSELNFDEIVGQSASLRQVLKMVETVAASDSTVLLLGETGTGKELIARAVHDHSRRKARTFVKMNCAAIPTGLLESELFGHERGAFTGAIAQKIGRLELADQGTLFLDEVGDIPTEIQPKLLRALQEREFERLGSTHTKRVNVRLVAATNRDLEKMTETREFRSDLYYRLNVFPIRIPPLRERPEDIPLLVRYFAEKCSRQMQKHIDSIPADAMQRLQSWHWPGNVRELENLIERAVILTTGSTLQVPLPEAKSPAASIVTSSPVPISDGAERELIIKTLHDTRGVLAGPSGAATRLGLKRTTLQYKIKKLNIQPNEWWPSSP